MNPWALIPWATAIGASILILTGPIVLLVFLTSIVRGKL